MNLSQATRVRALQRAYRKAEAANPRDDAPKAGAIRNLGLLGQEEDTKALLSKWASAKGYIKNLYIGQARECQWRRGYLTYLATSLEDCRWCQLRDMWVVVMVTSLGSLHEVYYLYVPCSIWELYWTILSPIFVLGLCLWCIHIISLLLCGSSSQTVSFGEDGFERGEFCLPTLPT